jgi:hypothetical protein
MTCEKIYIGICFVKPTSGLDSSIFGFSDFLMALALLVIVYTISDKIYKFRIAVTPTHLVGYSISLMAFIGFSTLYTDMWISSGWLVPASYITLPVWQGILGTLFLLLVMTWIYYASFKPPIFSEKNCRKFYETLYKEILKGSDSDLCVIAYELRRSADSLVKHAKQNPPMRQNKGEKEKKKEQVPNVGDYAHDVLLLIGSRKLCRNVVESSPITAISFFEDMSTYKKYNIPIGQFARNISTEAIINKDSILYHEDEGYRSGLIGYMKPFSQAIYGNYRLVEALHSNHGSPLDINYKIVWSWDATQLEAYTRAVTITLKNYLDESEERTLLPSSLICALKNIKKSCQDLYKLNNIISDDHSEDISERLSTVVYFIEDVIRLIDNQKTLPFTKLRRRKKQGNRRIYDFYDHIAELMFEIILSASSVTAPPEKCWSIHYICVWSMFFGYSNTGAWKIIHFKLRRLLYDEIRSMDKCLNYQTSRVLGFCLNVMGLIATDKKDKFRSNVYPLHKVVLAWTRKNYLRLQSTLPNVMAEGLIGRLSFDEKEKRLVITQHFLGLNLEAPKKYLELDPIDDS